MKDNNIYNAKINQKPRNWTSLLSPRSLRTPLRGSWSLLQRRRSSRQVTAHQHQTKTHTLVQNVQLGSQIHAHSNRRRICLSLCCLLQIQITCLAYRRISLLRHPPLYLRLHDENQQCSWRHPQKHLRTLNRRIQKTKHHWYDEKMGQVTQRKSHYSPCSSRHLLHRQTVYQKLSVIPIPYFLNNSIKFISDHHSAEV